MKLKWWEAIGKKACRNAHICSKHFKIDGYKTYEDLIRKILKPFAIPSVHIKLEPIENSLPDIKNILTVENEERYIFLSIEFPCTINLRIILNFEPLNVEHKNNIVQNLIRRRVYNLTISFFFSRKIKNILKLSKKQLK